MAKTVSKLTKVQTTFHEPQTVVQTSTLYIKTITNSRKLAKVEKRKTWTRNLIGCFVTVNLLISPLLHHELLYLAADKKLASSRVRRENIIEEWQPRLQSYKRLTELSSTNQIETRKAVSLVIGCLSGRFQYMQTMKHRYNTSPNNNKSACGAMR